MLLQDLESLMSELGHHVQADYFPAAAGAAGCPPVVGPVFCKRKNSSSSSSSRARVLSIRPKKPCPSLFARQKFQLHGRVDFHIARDRDVCKLNQMN